MTTTKRAYKLQEFVAHASSVNCLKIGRKTSRVLVTGGEDHKVNLWAIGKPNAILSLSGHTSAIESVSFDSSEVLVAAGAASGTIKLWDLEEAKIVRTLTGHRSNCISLIFILLGIWDIRRKGCIHTYKGHTRGVNAIRFTPDGRWVVSGGEDNVVKLWDLTAGKLLHDFKSHDGQIQCIDFHPHEFLLATGSSDRTVKFWDLETFEMIGSSGPETSGVRSMTFNSDGKTLLCGLHESLKVLSWEPIRCHDAVEVGWSRLSDLNVHEGKLLGCSHNQSCVGIWVVDISRVEPYAVAPPKSNGSSESKSVSSGSLSLQVDNTVKAGIGRLSISQNTEPVAKENKVVPSTGSVPGTPQRAGLNSGLKVTSTSSVAAPSVAVPKRTSSKTSQANIQVFNKSDVVPVIVPRTSPRIELPAESRKDIGIGRTAPYSVQPKLTDFRKLTNNRDDSEKTGFPVQSLRNETTGYKGMESDESVAENFPSTASVNGANQPAISSARNSIDVRSIGMSKLGANTLESNANHQSEDYDVRVPKTRDVCSVEVPRRGRAHSLVTNWEKRERSPGSEWSDIQPHVSSAEKQTVVATDEDAIANLLGQHEQFLSSTQSRLTKLQVVHRLWTRDDVKGVINAMDRMSDNTVSADVISVLAEKSDAVSLEICTCLLPLLTSLLDSKTDRHVSISLEMLLKLVKVFGSMIHSTVSASISVGVDLQAEQRLERCNLCFIELQKVKQCIPSLTRRGGSISKTAQELNLALQEVT
ncbi:unnamed protein product [Spirodela intermedia]|uniref:Katanin p80 WD40 repeat-containing subunit B1 homolog n=1 Tax=Spirodela intermedia TaxID=51605 RepID=A0A7I8ID21_SPIIN|nr:unnamed protein product [Spirodela intermedia]CAA6655698.1 unnamed protein product [Spirodela intermedia]